MEDLTKLSKEELLGRIHTLRKAAGVNDGENYKQCERIAKPLVDEYNRRGREIAKKYGRSWRTLTFRGFPKTY